MTEYTQTMLLPHPLRKAVAMDFDGGDLTSDSGLLLLAQADRVAGLTAAMAGALRDRRQQSKVAHSDHEMVQARVHAIACGYADANDLNTLRHDPALKLASGRAPLSGAALASQPTLSRFENQVTWRELVNMGLAMAACVIAQLPANTKRVVLDIDASVDPCHGQQEFEGFHAYYDCHCYLPLFLHLTDDQDTQWPVAALLRPGRVNPTAGVRRLLRAVVKLLRRRWPKLKILVRGDSGFGCDKVLRCCEALKVQYLFGLASNQRLEAMGRSTQEACQAAYEASLAQVKARQAAAGQAPPTTIPDECRQYAEFVYQAGSWPRCRDTILKVAMTQGQLNPRYVVTDLYAWGRAVLDAEATYELYCGRGDQENRIKEIKLDLQSGRTSCHRFLANQMRLLQHLAAHILWTVVRVAAKGTMWAKAQVATMQLQILKVAARVRETTRRVWFHLCTTYPHQQEWRLLLRRLGGAPASSRA